MKSRRRDEPLEVPEDLMGALLRTAGPENWADFGRQVRYNTLRGTPSKSIR
jgi:hypothetical protein